MSLATEGFWEGAPGVTERDGPLPRAEPGSEAIPADLCSAPARPSSRSEGFGGAGSAPWILGIAEPWPWHNGCVHPGLYLPGEGTVCVSDAQAEG